MKKLSLLVAALILGGMLYQANAEEAAQNAAESKPAVTAQSNKKETKLARKSRKHKKKAEKTETQATPNQAK